MTHQTFSDQMVAKHAFHHGLAVSWLGGFPEGCISWSMFQSGQRVVAVFEKHWNSSVTLVFFNDIDPATDRVVTNAYAYVRGDHEGHRPSKVLRRPDPILAAAAGTTLLETQPWAFVHACLERHRVEILKGDYASPPVGDYSLLKGRKNTPEHYYSGNGVEVRLHDVTPASLLEYQPRIYWLKIRTSTQVLLAKKVIGWAPDPYTELHVIEGLERWEPPASVVELEEVL